MSDDLVMRLRTSAVIDDVHDAADLIEAQAAEITRLRAALTTARREGMEQAAKIADSCAADWAKSAKGKYINSKWDFQSRSEAGEEIAAAIRAAAKEGKP